MSDTVDCQSQTPVIIIQTAYPEEFFLRIIPENIDGKLTYPVKVRGVGFMLNRKSLNILEMEDVKDLSIRLKDFSAY